MSTNEDNTNVKLFNSEHAGGLGGTEGTGFDSGKVNIDIKEVAARALADARILLSYWMDDGEFEDDDSIAPDDNRSNDDIFASIKIDAVTGQWSDSDTGACGNDLVSLYAYIFVPQDESEDPQKIAAYEISLDLADIAYWRSQFPDLR